ncbi:unnamed protein product [Euphydryas editha]|uniref:Uncharacterized protein n=1 Tax=Euphydryas editha TaxID=104508 RepID=A0AAU9UVA4_EUPED|nr:unnamed protein product [Euphydryas editha]
MDVQRLPEPLAEILREIKKFYGQLYASVTQPIHNLIEHLRAELTRLYSEDIPDIDLHETGMVLEELKSTTHLA